MDQRHFLAAALFASTWASTWALATPAAAQSLTWSSTTTSTRTHPSGSAQHTEHARPIGLEPFMVTAGGASTASVTPTFEIDIELTNAGSAGIDVPLSLWTSTVFVNNVTCWGVDGTSFTPFFTGETVTVPAGTTLTHEVTRPLQTETYQINGNCTAGDGLHTLSGQSNVFAGPAPVNIDWFFHPNDLPGVSGADLGTTVTIDVEVQVTYALPELNASTGCAPLAQNSTGAAGVLRAYGVADVQDGLVVLEATALPMNEFGFFVLSESGTAATPISFGEATLCLGAPQYRWLDTLALIDASGTVLQPVEASALPIPGGSIAPGETWHFQYFHRDTVLGQSSANSTNSVAVTY